MTRSAKKRAFTRSQRSGINNHPVAFHAAARRAGRTCEPGDGRETCGLPRRAYRQPHRGAAPARRAQPGGAGRPPRCLALPARQIPEGRQPPERHRPRRRGGSSACRYGIFREHAGPRFAAARAQRPAAGPAGGARGMDRVRRGGRRAADTHLDGDRRQALGSLVRAVDHALSGQQSFDKANVSAPSD